MDTWLYDLLQDGGENVQFAPGASSASMSYFEAQLGIHLPPSYRQFLQAWNGARFGLEHIFSHQEVMHYLKNECGFLPYRGGPVHLTGEAPQQAQRYHLSYNLKPTHFLAFGKPSLSMDLHCFDTSRHWGDEFVICEFCHDENDIDCLLRPAFPSFSAFLLDSLYQAVSNGQFFQCSHIENEAARHQAERLQTHWEERLGDLLLDAGANLDAPPYAYWERWQQGL